MNPMIRALVAKDVRLFLTDRRAIIVSLIVPLALGALMGALTGGKGTKPVDIPVAYSDQDDGDVSHEITAKLEADSTVALTKTTPEAARDLVGKGKVQVAIVLPKGFGQQAQRSFFGGGERPVIQLLYDPSRLAVRGMVEGILTKNVMQVVSHRLFSADSGAAVVADALKSVQNADGMDPQARATLQTLLGAVLQWQQQQAKAPEKKDGEGAGFRMPYETKSEAVSGGDEQYNGYAHSFAGMGVQFVLFTGIELAVAILTERQRGMWRRFRAAPLPRRTLLLSRALSGAIIAFGVFAALMLAGNLFFHVQVLGSLPGLVAVLAAFALMCAGFGLMIAAIGKTPQAARGLSVFAVLIMVMLGGAWFPAFLFPPLLQKITLVMPTRWAVDALDAMTWRGLGLEAALPAVGVLLAFALAFGAVALLRFRWDADA